MFVLLPSTLTNLKQGTKELGPAILATHHTGFLNQCFSASLQEHKVQILINILPEMFVMGISSCEVLYILF